MLYRICTEDRNRNLIAALLDGTFEGYTLLTGQGAWKGQPERSLTIEVITDDRDTVFQVAETIRRMNDQEAVLVQSIPALFTFVREDARTPKEPEAFVIHDTTNDAYVSTVEPNGSFSYSSKSSVMVFPTHAAAEVALEAREAWRVKTLEALEARFNFVIEPVSLESAVPAAS